MGSSCSLEDGAIYEKAEELSLQSFCWDKKASG